MTLRVLFALAAFAAAGVAPALAAEPMAAAYATPGTMADPDRCLDRRLPAAEAATACEQAPAGGMRLEGHERAALLHRRGEIEAGMGRPTTATSYLEEARRLKPELAPYALTLGDALVAAGETDRAKATFREGQKLAPSARVFRERLEELEAMPAAASGVAPK